MIPFRPIQNFLMLVRVLMDLYRSVSLPFFQLTMISAILFLVLSPEILARPKLTIYSTDLGVIGPKIISLNPRRLWFSSALSDPVLFQATLYSAALYSNSVWRSGDSPLAIFHRTQLLGMVNNRLRDPTQGLSDKTVAAVALIVYTEVT